MSKKTGIPGKRILLTSVSIGLLIAFGLIPLNRIVLDMVRSTITIQPWEEIAATGIIGIFYLGVLIYFFTMMVLSIFSRNLLNYLVKELRSKELLPVKFKMDKRGGLGATYREIISIFDSFIQLFMSVKQDKDKFAKTMGTFLDPNLKKEIEDRGIGEIYVGGKKKTMTIFFSDLRGFTRMTEAYDPNIVVSILNDYFTIATKQIDNNHGRVNKYIGDAILAVFEEPPKYLDFLDADKAVVAALDIQSEFKIQLKKWRELYDPKLDLGLGIGLARGEVISGNIGSESRMEHTVIGDTVNLASRLCGKAQDGQVIIPNEIYKIIEHLVEVEILPDVEVKGKTGLYGIYSVLTRKMIV